MTRHQTRRERDYGPLRDKTLTNVLRQLFITEFGYDNKVLFAEAMIERILATIEAFIQPRSQLKPGQVVWMAVAHDGRKHAYKAMKDIPLVPVVLDLVTDEDLQALAQGTSFLNLRRGRLARLGRLCRRTARSPHKSLICRSPRKLGKGNALSSRVEMLRAA